MLNLGFKNKYKIVHLTPEIGKHMAGGICTFMNELYKNHDDDIGFIEIYPNGVGPINPNLYDDVNKDLLVLESRECNILGQINADVFVVHIWTLAEFISNSIIESRNIVYVIHSIPTTEPWNKMRPFENDITKRCFEHLCYASTAIICVSESEKNKLCTLYPKYEEKIHVIHNGINNTCDYYNNNYEQSRKIFGYIGRAEQRKGLYELIKDITKYDVKFKVATGQPDRVVIQKIIQYLDATNNFDKVDFLGWCGGARKDKFFKSIDALIIPSLYEPFGYIALEAMQYGIPIISSCNGGLKEILGENYRYLYNPYLKDDFDRVMDYFINDDNKIIKDQVAILKERLKNFTIEEMVKKYNTTLLSLKQIT